LSFSLPAVLLTHSLCCWPSVDGTKLITFMKSWSCWNHSAYQFYPADQALTVLSQAPSLGAVIHDLWHATCPADMILSNFSQCYEYNRTF
jgi:hypothetical protein